MKKILIIPLLGVIAAFPASAAIITTQAGGSIDPAGNVEIDSEATGSVTLAAFNSLSGKNIQANYTGISGTTGNTIDGADIDVRIDHGGTGGSFAASASGANPNSFNTASVGNAYQWLGTNGQQLTISFGTADAVTPSIFTNDRTVYAAGLALTQFGSAYTNVTITYYDSTDTVLSTQSFVGTADFNADQSGGAGSDWFTGYIASTGNYISYLTIDLTRTAAGSGSSDVALDAVTFVAVPEPSTYAIYAGFLAFGLVMWRRRFRD
jgi:hypothetical protein